MLAVSLSVIQAVDAAPHGAFSVILGPDNTAIQGAAFAADQDAGQSVFGAVFPQAGGGTLFRAGGSGIPAGGFLLHGVENLPADDGFMVVLDQDLGELSGVFDDLLTDAVLDEGFLQKHVTAVFLVLQDGLDAGDVPDSSMICSTSPLVWS